MGPVIFLPMHYGGGGYLSGRDWLEIIGQGCGVTYTLCSGVWALGHYMDNPTAYQIDKQLPTHLYEFYHGNGTLLNSVLYNKHFRRYDYRALYRELAHTTSELKSFSELEPLLEKHNIVRSTPDVKFPVTMVEYKFPNGVFESLNKYVHTDKEILRRVSAMRALWPGTGVIAAITGITLALS